MQVQTILNQCYKFKSFVYHQVRFVTMNGEKCIEVDVLPRRNSRPICSCCEKPAALYDSLNKRRFEFIPMWGVLGVSCLPDAPCKVLRLRGKG